MKDCVACLPRWALRRIMNKSRRVLMKRMLISFIGVMLLSVAMGILVKLNAGAEPIATVYACLARILQLSVGTVSLIANAVLCCLVFLVDKRKIGASTLLFLLLNKWPLDWAITYFPAVDHPVMKIMLILSVLAVTAFGSDLLICANFGSTAYDACNLAVSERCGFPYPCIRWMMDGTLLLIAVFLHGTIGIGTLCCFLFIGLFLNMWRHTAEKGIMAWMYEVNSQNFRESSTKEKRPERCSKKHRRIQKETMISQERS